MTTDLMTQRHKLRLNLALKKQNNNKDTLPHCFIRHDVKNRG